MEGMHYHEQWQKKQDDIPFNLKLKIIYMLSAINNCKLHFIEWIVTRSVLTNIPQFEDVHMKNKT